MRALLAAGLIAVAASANADPPGFPEGATPLEEAALRQLISGKDFISPSFSQWEARYQFYKDGTAWLHIKNLYDKGPWRVEGSRICVDWKFGTPGCFEVRQFDGRLFTRLGELRPD